ncbi:Na+/H+ antiporter NhaC [Chryseomicrobium aureum]|uniref:Na+/H+ antiporter NhaC family protein n=1 Tax=Chryseomicrobium aureum TaxID=1441723 RepID=UPI00195BA6D0|nr:Na+/H+ antiporter NhaC family protein [Chryseomicrobium aureum]MBM7707574.1 Na+/H+ antiporter NhaC [Chryseomicrobium aureum]
MEATIFSLVPPLLAIIMVLVTRRVLLSLGVGIVSAAFLLHEFSPMESIQSLWTAFQLSFWDEGFNAYNVFIILFILSLGVITALVTLSGGSRAFAAWAMKRVKTRRGAKLLTAFIGILIFIDDYFNALAVGQISRPITDSHKISRAKLAYFIDSTSAPVCVVSPISSWGAYLISILGGIFSTYAIVAYTPLEAFVLMAPMNYYVVAALAIVFFVAATDFDLFAMKSHEKRALETGQLFDPEKDVAGEIKEEFPVHNHGKVSDLVLPIVTLLVATVGAMLITGNQAGGSWNLFTIFENTDVPKSLLIGGLAGVAVALFSYLRQFDRNPEADSVHIGAAFLSGIRSMMPAVLILVFAWALTYLISELQTGEYLAGIVTNNNIPEWILPALLFVITAIMAFSTGTSWGSFGILIPIGADIAMAVNPELLLPVLSAVLAGAVFGDHCSPISDTTIMSATGAGSNLYDHVITQLPYAIISAVIAALGYLVLGFTGSAWIGLGFVLIVLILLFIFWSAKERVQQTAS